MNHKLHCKTIWTARTNNNTIYRTFTNRRTI